MVFSTTAVHLINGWTEREYIGEIKITTREPMNLRIALTVPFSNLEMKAGRIMEVMRAGGI